VSLGWFVMKWGAGRWTSVAWFLERKDARAEVDRIVLVGAWSGMPPRVSR
jgi:hypothetical protein